MAVAYRRAQRLQVVPFRQGSAHLSTMQREDSHTRFGNNGMQVIELAACRTEVFGGVAISGILPAIGKLAGRRAGVEAILAQLAGLMKPAAGFVPAEPALRRASG